MACVTHVRSEAFSSIVVDEKLMSAAGFSKNEKVQVLNMMSGSRVEVPILPGPKGAGEISLNGVMSHHGRKGDRIVIIGYCLLRDDQKKSHRPKKIVLNEKNRIVA